MEDVAACFSSCSGLLLESWKAPLGQPGLFSKLRWLAGELQPSLAQEEQQKGQGEFGAAQRSLCPADVPELPQTDTSALSQAVPHLSWSQAAFARVCSLSGSLQRGWKPALGSFPTPLWHSRTEGEELLTDVCSGTPQLAAELELLWKKPNQRLQREQVPGAGGLDRQEPGGASGVEVSAGHGGHGVDMGTPAQGWERMRQRGQCTQEWGSEQLWGWKQ